MAIIYTYPIVTPTSNDLVLGTDVDAQGKPTKNFTIQSIIDLVTVSGNDLQAVLNNGNSATQNIILTGNISATQYTDGTMSIVGGVGTGFSSITSTDFVGNITGIVKAGSSIAGTVTGVTQAVGTSNTTLATTAFVMSKVDPSILQYLGDTGGGPFDLNLVSDDFKIAGTANQIETTAATVTGNVGIVTLKFPTAGVTLPDGSVATTQAATDDSTKVATTAFVRDYDDLQDLDFSGTTGTGAVLLNSETLAIAGTANQVVTSAAGQTLTIALTNPVVRDLTGNVTGILKDGSSIETTVTGVTQTAGNDSTRLATTAYVDAAAGAKVLQYQADVGAGGQTQPFTLNLSTDDLDIAGGSNITTTASTVAANLGVITIDLNNDVSISDQMEAQTYTTLTGTATWTGTVLAGFTSITSTDFVGALTGNASTATALASSGAIALTGDTTSTGGPYTYTSGGALSIATTIADTTVTGKVLTNLPTPTSGSIAASDTILAAMAKLQGQITSTTGLAYEGTWDPGNSATAGGTPDLRLAANKVNGHFYICSAAGIGTPNGDGTTPNSWAIGDWVIYVSNGSSTDEWQKLDQSNEVLGSGAANKIAKWTATNTLGTGLIEDNGTTVTVGNSGNLTVEGNTTLGDADSDTTTVKGPAHFEETLRADVGIGLGGATYGSSGQVLTSGGGAASVNTWTTPTTGVVESITGNYGITIGGTAAIPTVAITTDVNNLINQATAKATPVGADSILINDSAATNVLKKSTISSLPFDNFAGWVLSDNESTPNTTTIGSGGTAKFAGGTYITTGESSGTLTINHDATSRTDTTSTDSPAFGGTFEAVTSVTSNATGHVTAIDVSTVTIPSNPVMTAATAAAAGVQGLVPGSAAGDQLKFLRADATWVVPDNDQGVTSVTATAPISSSGGTTPNITHDTSGVTAGTYDSVTVDVNGHVTAGSNPGGSGGGIFSGDQAIAAGATTAVTAFTLTRATTGTLVFDVWLTSETSIHHSVAKKYTVAHSFSTNPVYNKIIDTGPDSSNAPPDNDFIVTFVNSNTGATGTSCECKIANVSNAIEQNIGYTVQVGHDSTNALTFTAAS